MSNKEKLREWKAKLDWWEVLIWFFIFVGFIWIATTK
jgi:hypothetical protein